MLMWGEGKIGSAQMSASMAVTTKRSRLDAGRHRAATTEDFKGHGAQGAPGGLAGPPDKGGVHQLQEALPVPRGDAQPPALRAAAF